MGMTAIPVIARWNRTVWHIQYRDPCEFCGRRHYHGGGDGPTPDMGSGTWGSHCTAAGHPTMVNLTLTEIEPRTPHATNAR